MKKFQTRWVDTNTWNVEFETGEFLSVVNGTQNKSLKAPSFNCLTFSQNIRKYFDDHGCLYFCDKNTFNRGTKLPDHVLIVNTSCCKTLR